MHVNIYYCMEDKRDYGDQYVPQILLQLSLTYV